MERSQTGWAPYAMVSTIAHSESVFLGHNAFLNELELDSFFGQQPYIVTSTRTSTSIVQAQVRAFHGSIQARQNYFWLAQYSRD